MKKGMKLETFAMEIERREAAKRDFVADSGTLHFEIENGPEMRSPSPRLTVAGEDFRIAETARGQIAQRMGFPKRFFDRLTDEPRYHAQFENLLNRMFEVENSQHMVRTLDGNVRAFLSNRYRMIDNFDVVNAVIPILSEVPEMKVESAMVNDSSMTLKCVFPRISGEVATGDVVTSGLVISNSEVGKGSFRIEPLVYRLVCQNGMIASTALKKNHVGRAFDIDGDAYEIFSDDTLAKSDEALLAQIRDLVRASLDEAEFARQLDILREAAGREIENPKSTVRELSKRYKLTDETEGKILGLLTNPAIPGQREAGMTQWGLVNAITFAAKQCEDYDESTQFERLGGEVVGLDDRAWQGLVAA